MILHVVWSMCLCCGVVLSDCIVGRLYPRYGSSVSHLPQSPTRTNQNNDTFDEQRNKDNFCQRNKEPLSQRNNRLSWPQFTSPNQLATKTTSNKQRTGTDEGKPALRSAIKPEDAKVLERASQIVMYVLFNSKLRRELLSWWWFLCGGGILFFILLLKFKNLHVCVCFITQLVKYFSTIPEFI